MTRRRTRQAAGLLTAGMICTALSAKAQGNAAMTDKAETTAWGTPVTHMWACEEHQWGKPALGIPLQKGVRHAPIFEPDYDDGAYNHHPEIAWHKGRFHAMWSNNKIGEDRAGQRILYSSTDDVTTWPAAQLLFPQPGPFFDQRTSVDDNGKPKHGFYMTAMKFIPLDGRLYAVAAFDNTGYKITPLVRELRDDGSLGEIFALRADYPDRDQDRFPFPFARSDTPPYKEPAEALLKLYLTPAYLPSWNFGIDDLFKRPRMVEGPTMCEWSIHQAKDGKYVMLARDKRHSHRMYVGFSDSPDPNSFSPLGPTDIPDTPSKSVTINLADGTTLLIGNQQAKEMDNIEKPRHYERDPLTISISNDGYHFTRQVVLRWEGGRRWRTRRGRVSGRGAGCQYPAAMVHDGMLYVIYSIGKEDVAVSWVETAKLLTGNKE